MQRDMELVRAIAFAIEASEGGFAPMPFKIDGYDQGQVNYHTHLMSEAGLIDAIDATNNDSDGPEAIPRSLTWAGHEFLDAARNEGIWRTTMAKVKTTAGTVTLGVLTQLLTAGAKTAVGLPQ